MLWSELISALVAVLLLFLLLLFLFLVRNVLVVTVVLVSAVAHGVARLRAMMSWCEMLGCCSCYCSCCCSCSCYAVLSKYACSCYVVLLFLLLLCCCCCYVLLLLKLLFLVLRCVTSVSVKPVSVPTVPKSVPCSKYYKNNCLTLYFWFINTVNPF